MKKAITFMLTLVIAVVGMTMHAQAPQTGVYRIQNVGGQKYVKVTSKYDAQLVESQQDASYITVGIEKKLSDGTYKVNSLASTYGSENTPVEVYDYIPKALTLAEVELRKILKNSSEENVKKAIARMHELAEQYAFMRLMPVDGQADTYHAIAVLPYIPKDVVDVWTAKVKEPKQLEIDMWQWCKDLVVNYLNTHGTDSGLKDKILNNIDAIHEGHTYMLTEDTDGSFGYIETGANIRDEETYETTVNPATLKYDNNRSYWKLTPKVNTDNVKDGTYKIRNLGTKKYVSIKSKYYAKPDAEEANASDIRITFNGEAYGGQKIVNLGGTYKDENGKDVAIEIYDYIKKAIMIGKVAIADVLKPGNNDGVNPASPENVVVAQETMEKFVKDNAFMCMKPVPNKDDAVYAYAYIPVVPAEVAEAMCEHGALSEYGVTSSSTLADKQAAAWKFGVKKVKQYLNDHNGEGGTDNTLSSYILANIDKIRPGVTYYLGAEDNDTFDYAPETATETQDAADLSDEHFMWGFDVEEVEEDNLTSGTYKIRNVETGDYVEVLSKYYAKPDTDEENATEIHITYNGKLDDGSYKVTNMSAVAKDDSQCDIQSYVDKAIMLGRAAIADVLSGEVTVDGETVHVASPENIKKAQDFMEKFVRESAFMRVKPVAGTNYVYAIATIPEIPAEVVEQMVAHIDGVNNAEDCWNYGKQYVLNYLDGHPNSTLVSLITNNLDNLTPGHTYYLSEDENKTFGYVDALNFSSTNKRLLQWGIDLEKEDQPVESDFYKIHNVGTGKYVHVEGMYYAKVNKENEEDATPIQVSVAEQLEDGSYKVTNLVGDGHNIQSYIQHAIQIGEAVIDTELAGHPRIDDAKARMREFIEANAYMRIRKVPNEENAYYAYATAPVIPDDIVAVWRNRYPNYEGTMWKWCVEKVKTYLDGNNSTNSTLKSLILNNIDKIEEGHTYYLSAETNDTFGYKDANEMDLSNSNFWWGFTDAVKGEPANGYFRIKNAAGDYYVCVTGPFAAQPNKTQEEAKSLPGTIIYVGMDEEATGDAFRVNTLRSQGVNANAYFNAITTVIDDVAQMAAEILEKKVEETSFKKYASLVGPVINMLKESIDINAYAEPTLTSEGKDAYMLKATVPDLAEYCDMATFAMDMVGLTKGELVTKLQQKAAASTSDLGKLAYGLAAKIANYIDNPEMLWEKAIANITNPENDYYQLIASMGLPEEMVAKALNNLQKIHYGTTYCLSHQNDNSFDLVARDEARNSDASKWILEPADLLEISKVDNHNPDYEIVVDETTTKPAAIQTDNQGYNWTTLYTDFDMELASGDKAYKVVGFKLLTQDDPVNKVTNYFYLAETKELEGVVPAQTPVLLRTKNQKFLLTPTGTPDPETAISSKDYVNKILGITDFVNGMLTGGNGGSGAPRLRAEDESDEKNFLVGEFFDKPNSSQSLYPLDTNSSHYDNQSTQMQGLGFWVNDLNEIEGNRAYLDASNDESYYFPGTQINETQKEIAVGYIISYSDGNQNFVTEINVVDAAKEIANIMYYNASGIESNKPFDGINIVVTTYTDGTKVSSKIIR